MTHGSSGWDRRSVRRETFRWVQRSDVPDAAVVAGRRQGHLQNTKSNQWASKRRLQLEAFFYQQEALDLAAYLEPMMGQLYGETETDN